MYTYIIHSFCTAGIQYTENISTQMETSGPGGICLGKVGDQYGSEVEETTYAQKFAFRRSTTEPRQSCDVVQED